MSTPIDRIAESILSLSRPVKRGVTLALDLALCALAVYVAFYLRLGEWIQPRGSQWFAILISCGLAIPIFIFAGLYRAIFRFSGMAAMLSISQAAIVYGVIYATILTAIEIPDVPRTVGFIQPAVLYLLVVTTRIIASWWLGGLYINQVRANSKSRVVIFGAGQAGRQLFHALQNSEMRVVAFIDDDPSLHGRLLFGVPVRDALDVEQMIKREGVTNILLALPSASRRRRKEILDLLEPFGVKVQTMPGLTDVALGRVKVGEVLDLDLDDLLGRESVPPDIELLSDKVRGKIVLVTGAGGSIGSELCRQVLESQPTALLLVDNSEAALYTIHRELELRHSSATGEARIMPLLGSVSDMNRMASIITTWRPSTIYHAAAYKHVPLVEHNTSEGVYNNVFGTLTLATAARDAGVANFVLVSTDKAVRPTNVMGATKRLAEQILQALAVTSSDTCFSMVRFGNVLGSSGSVVPLFRDQIRAGGPITVTHPEVTRYFMSIPEAAQLVIQAGAMAQGGEVFVLDMGGPVKIVDLARRMVVLSGLKIRTGGDCDGDIEFQYVGLRPGEKLYEELLIGNEPVQTTHPRILKANEAFIPWPALTKQLSTLKQAINVGNVDNMLAILRRLVPEYAPNGEVVDWMRTGGQRAQIAQEA